MLTSKNNFLTTFMIKLRDIYLHLSLKVKFSLVIGSITIVMILLFSFSVLETGKDIVREKVEEIYKLSIQSLVSVAKENLLIQNHAPIQEVINEMVSLELEGFESAFVLNRDGVIVAHSDLTKINELKNDYKTYLSMNDNLKIFGSEDHSEYLHKIVMNTEINGASEDIITGLADIKFSHAMIDSTFDSSKNMIFLLTIGIILLSIFFVNIFSRRLTSSIVDLSDGVKELGKGNLDVVIHTPSKDEIGLLAEEFNNMVQSLRENAQMKKFVSSLTVDMIQSQSGLNTESKAMEREMITVLFSDIRGFTSLSETFEPEQLVEIINVYLNMQSHHIVNNNGVIDKFAGDQIMAIFPGDKAPDDAIKAAVQIQKGLIEINQERRKEKKECLTVGIGINYGYAILGSMGAKSRMDYTAIGDVVNLASKLCNYARSGDIVITKSVIESLTGTFSVVKMEPAKLSGRKNAVPIYRITY